ncbi:MAG: MFS transporter [Phycisphaerales bacterium]|nr:MFS transporter [Phycisphaerales bacterium]
MPGAIPDRLACNGCACDLKGLEATAACPECGHPIASTMNGVLPAGKRQRWGVLRHAHFRNVWIGSFGSSLGGWMEHVGIRWVMTTITMSQAWKDAGHPDATIMLGYLTTVALLPSLFLGMVGGLVADRMNRKTMLLLTRIFMMLIALALVFASAFNIATPLVLMILSGLQGVAIAFDAPASQVLTPRLVPRHELTEAIHLMGIQFNLARVIGPALGGFILSATTPTWLFIINTLSFLGVLISVARTPDSPAPPRKAGERSVLGEAWHDIAEALSFVFHRRGPRAAFLALVIFAIFATPLIQLLPVFIRDVYHREEATFGVLLGVMGIGAVTGGVLARRIPKWYPMHHFIPLSIFGGGVSIGLFAMMSSVWLAGACMFFVGVFWVWSFNSSMAAMQLLVDDAMRGRVLAICNTMALGLMPLGTLLAGWVGHVFVGPSNSGDSAQIGIGVMAGILVIAGIFMLLRRTPEVDGPVPDGAHPERGLLRAFTASEHRPQRRPEPEPQDVPSWG